MSGSAAEERIRTKVEAMFRARLPDARIIHELVLDQGGVRIDLAAVTADRLVVAEIKSERDVLKRLRSQVNTALAVAQEVWVFVASKHAATLQELAEPRIWRALYGPPGLPDRGGWSNPTPSRAFDNPDHIPGLLDCYLRVEPAAGNFEPLPNQFRTPRWDPLLNPADPLQMLWRDELARLTAPLGAGKRATRDDMIHLAVEHLSGKEVRRAVCRMLRCRAFPRADAPVRPA